MTLSARNEIASGQVLGNGQDLISHNCKYRLIMQGDGNVVLLKQDGNSQYSIVKWHSHTGGQDSPPYSLVMQGDNNLVIYNSHSVATWNTGTTGQGAAGAKAILQDDGNFVVYDTQWAVLWHTHTTGE